jgi:hypothetical protein
MKLPNSELNLVSDLSNSVLTLVSHDAGGANVLDAFVRNNHLIPHKLNLAGPAKNIIGSNTFVDNELIKFGRQDIVLASTGWQSEFEKKQIKFALENNKRVIVFLDNWTNFSERIFYENEVLTVAEFVTFDKFANGLANVIFNNAKVYQFPNYYLIEQSAEILRIRDINKNYDLDYLYIGEPIRNKEYSEIDAFENFLTKARQKESGRLKIAIRPHPSESREKYVSLISRLDGFIFSVSDGTTLVQDLSRAKIVVGCNSMALEMAHISRIPVFCAIPEPFKSEIPFDFFEDWI